MGAVNSVGLLHGAWLWVWGRGGIGKIPPPHPRPIGVAPQQRGPGSAVCEEGERWDCALLREDARRRRKGALWGRGLPSPPPPPPLLAWKKGGIALRPPLIYCPSLPLPMTFKLPCLRVTHGRVGRWWGLRRTLLAAGCFPFAGLCWSLERYGCRWGGGVQQCPQPHRDEHRESPALRCAVPFDFHLLRAGDGAMGGAELQRARGGWEPPCSPGHVSARPGPAGRCAGRPRTLRCCSGRESLCKVLLRCKPRG